MPMLLLLLDTCGTSDPHPTRTRPASKHQTSAALNFSMAASDRLPFRDEARGKGSFKRVVKAVAAGAAAAIVTGIKT